MKKTHWFRNTLIVLIACGLAGTILAAILFSNDSGRTSASASIQFSFNGSENGVAPNGYRFDVSGFNSDEVLNAALEASGLAGTYSAEQIRENMTVSGIYPEKIVEQMTKYVSLLDADADSQAAVLDYHATEYSVVLYNDFDKNILSSQLIELLKNIMTAYRAYFAKVYAPNLNTEDIISDLTEQDYYQQLEVISGSVSQQAAYAQKMESIATGFSVNQNSFGDVAIRYQNLQSDIDRLNATVTLNAVSKDRKLLQERYATEIRTQQYQLDSLTEELKQIDELLSSYDKDGIIYVSSSGKLEEVGSDETGTYDKLVSRRGEVMAAITDAKAKIALYQGRLDDITEMDTTEAADETEKTTAASNDEDATQLQADVEKKIEALIAKKNAITADFAAMLDAYEAQEINEKTVSITAAKYHTPSLISGAFIVRVLRTAGPICAVGFMVCMVLLIISRRKEEKA